MNLLIKNKLKEAIIKADKNKQEYFIFQPEDSYEINKREKLSASFSKSGEPLKYDPVRMEIEKIKKEDTIKKIKIIEEELYEKNNFLSNIYIKNQKIFFFGLEIYLTDDYLIFKTPAQKRIYISLNKPIVFDYERGRIKIKNNNLEDTVYIGNALLEKEETSHKDIMKINKRTSFFKLFQDFIEIIIINKNNI